ncbi:MAG: glycoside hydrolase family 78 protein, partial [Clostridiales bacterium]|nr:glycoside hydrolase family 78 protein [Clostridiales bacterium]
MRYELHGGEWHGSEWRGSELHGGEWHGSEAKWISAPYLTNLEASRAAPYFRRAVQLKGPLAAARLYICGLGYHEAWIEGRPVSEDLLEPAYTKYDKTVYYSEYDVTGLIEGRRFAVGVILGNGWYNYAEADEWDAAKASWRAWPKLLAELRIAYADGGSERVATGTDWLCRKSPVAYNCIRAGEAHNARLETEGWNRWDCPADGWDAAIVARPPGGTLRPRRMPPVRVMETLPCQKLWQNRDGNWVFDFGQNVAGKARLTMRGPVGQQVVLRYSESLTEDGAHVEQGYLRGFVKSGDFQTDRYTKGGSGAESWAPRFVYHGFRYVEASGLGWQVDPEDAVALAMRTAFERTGSLETSDGDLQTVQRLCHRSTVSNFMSVPTDCPHREKNPWLGDAAVASEQMLYNYGCEAALEKWLDDIVDAQRPDGALPCMAPTGSWGYNWGNGPDYAMALPDIAWELYERSGDKALLARYYPAMLRQLAYIGRMATGRIAEYGVGDWCAPFDGEAISANMGACKAPLALTDTACYHRHAVASARAAALLGRDAEAADCWRLAGEIRAAWRGAFLAPDGSAKISGDCQTSYACALYYGLLEEGERPAALARLVGAVERAGCHPDYGLLGSKWVPQALGAAGRADLVHRLAVCKGYPGYLHWAELGRTALGECWNGKGSQNHCMFSDISAALYKYVAGIRFEAGGGGRPGILLRPSLLPGLQWLRCACQSRWGQVRLEWRHGPEPGQTRLEISLPPGARARLDLPVEWEAEAEAGAPAFLEAGEHAFAARI